MAPSSTPFSSQRSSTSKPRLPKNSRLRCTSLTVRLGITPFPCSVLCCVSAIIDLHLSSRKRQDDDVWLSYVYFLQGAVPGGHRMTEGIDQSDESELQHSTGGQHRRRLCPCHLLDDVPPPLRWIDLQL